MANDQKAPVLPETSFTVDGAEYKFKIPSFVFDNEKWTAEQALDKPELLKQLVDTCRLKDGKPEVNDGLLELVSGTVVASSTKAPKLAPAADVIAAIGKATAEAEIDALIAGDTRKIVLDAATARKAKISAK